MMKCLSRISGAMMILFVGINVSTQAQDKEPAYEHWKIPSPQTVQTPQGDAVPDASAQSYPDEAGFEQRRAMLIRALSEGDLGKWRRGYFKGGDPGKYLPHHAMARLLMNPEDQEVVQLMNDRRSYREHYHFASANWGRYYPLLVDRIITKDTQGKFKDKAFKYANYLKPHGTENHRTQNFTSASVLPFYTDHGLSHHSKEDTLKKGKELLRDYVKGLYTYGQGEWDSSTYVMFDVNGLLNIYDFSKDEETRLIARAGLDWLAAAYALKYMDGVYTAPNQRGFASGPMEKIADQTGWLWWGATAQADPKKMQAWRYAMPAAISGWRPSLVITNLAQKKVKLPFEQRNSKPNYYYGQQIPGKLSQYHETLWATEQYTLGTLWNGHGSQITRMQLVVKTEQGAKVMTGGHPRRSDHTGKMTDIGYKDGNGRYDQAMQLKGTHITLSAVPEDEKDVREAFFSLPKDAAVINEGAWMVWVTGKTYIAVRGISGQATMTKMPLTKKQLKRNEKAQSEGRPLPYSPQPMISFPEREGVTGFILETGDASEFESIKDFMKALKQGKLVNNSADAVPSVRYTTIKGESIQMKYNTKASTPLVAINEEVVQYGNWPIYQGPYLNQSNGVLSISDGVNSYEIEFTDQLPVYRKDK